MTEEDLELARVRYVRLFGNEGAAPGDLDAIEDALSVKLPSDFRKIAAFYSGGLLGGISLNSIAPSGPATNVVEETTRLRAAVSLPHEFVVLAEPPDSLIVLRTTGEPARPATVIWCSAFDVARLDRIDSLTTPDIWADYYSFFVHLLGQEEADRGEDS